MISRCYRLRLGQCMNARTLPVVAQHQFLRHQHVHNLRISNRSTVVESIQSTVHRTFTTAYQGTPSDGKKDHNLLADVIPYQSTLKDGRRVEVDFFRHSPTDIEEDEWFAGLALMNLIIREGRSWPFEEEFDDVESWRGYFLSHTAFVVRALDNGMDAAKRNSSSQGEILGCFYVKPNFVRPLYLSPVQSAVQSECFSIKLTKCL